LRPFKGGPLADRVTDDIVIILPFSGGAALRNLSKQEKPILFGRFTAGAAGFFILSQSQVRPET
jgi:hypothetical protein